MPTSRAILRLAAPLAITGGLYVSGCIITHPMNPAATQPATVVDFSTTQPSYWMSQPANARVTDPDFDKLWNACEETCRRYYFPLDRQDYREGILTTKPLVSAQWFEFWRHDTTTLHQKLESDIATIRRTIRYEFSRDASGNWQAIPKVLVERRTISENRITAVVSYQGIFNVTAKTRDQPSGSLESDEGVPLRPRYWYALGRDPQLEKRLADDTSRRLRQPLPQ